MSFLRNFSEKLSRLDPGVEIPMEVLTDIALVYVQSGGQMTPGLWLELPTDERAAFHAAHEITWRRRAQALAEAIRDPDGIAKLTAPIEGPERLHDHLAKWAEDQLWA